MRDFTDRIREEYSFYGVDNLMFKLDTWVFEAIEDETDGYRSNLDTIQHVGLPDMVIFRNSPLAKVRIEEVNGGPDTYDDDGYRLVDVKDGHVWLEVGTNWNDDYYPCFYFRYHPKEDTSE